MKGFCHLFITPSGVRTFLVSGGHCNNARDTSLVLLYSRELTNPGYVGTITNLKSSSQNPKMEHFNPTLPPQNSSIIPVTGKPEYPHPHTWA